MTEIKSCGPLCQHPSCWNDEKDRMIEALKRLYEGEIKKTGTQDDFEATIKTLNTGIMQEPLPTLKIVNVFENDEDDQHDVNLDRSSYYLHLLSSSKENQFPISSAGTRSSRLPKAPCATPSPSYASQYFNRQRKKAGKTITDDQTIAKTDDMVKAASVQLQDCDDREDQYSQTFVPYLVWVPSKRDKNKIEDLEKVRSTEVPKVAMKNITGSNPDFGFLSTPFNKETALKCYSRATHTVRSSPNRLQPRRLPPISRDASDRSRSPRHQPTGLEGPDIRLTGDGLLKSEKRILSLNTPQNTRASIFTNGKLEEWNSRESARHSENEERHSLCIVDDDTMIIHNGMEADSIKRDLYQTNGKLFATNVPSKGMRGNRDVKEFRAELPLPRVTVPRAKLSKLPIDNHCRNSVPSHNLPDIEMQPIYGTDRAFSDVTSIENSVSRTEEKTVPDAFSDEVQLSEEQYQKLFETVVTDKRKGLEPSEEEFYSHWEEETLQAPAPTPSSPQKKMEPCRLDDSDIIEAIKEEQFIDSMQDPVRATNFNEDSRPPLDCTATHDDANRVSPVLSKTSSGDFPSDKDIMRKTYEQYRSFTPFKTPGVSLIDARLESIREASREHTYLSERERSIVLSRAYTVSMNSRTIPNHFKKMARGRDGRKLDGKAKTSNNVPLPMRSFIKQRRSYVENLSDLNFKKLKRTQRRMKSEYLSLTHDHLDAPFLVKKLSLQDPATKLHHESIPGYEVYEALFRSESCHNDEGEPLPFVIQVPNPTPDKESIKSKSLVSLLGIGTGDVVESSAKHASICDAKVGSKDSMHSLEDGAVDVNVSLDAESPVKSTESGPIDALSNPDLPNDENHVLEKVETEKCDVEQHSSERMMSSTDLERKPGMLSEAKTSQVTLESDSEHSFLGCINLLSDIRSEMDFSLNLSDQKSNSTVGYESKLDESFP